MSKNSTSGLVGLRDFGKAPRPWRFQSLLERGCGRRVDGNGSEDGTGYETVFVECARALGKRAVLEGGKTDAERLTFAFRV